MTTVYGNRYMASMERGGRRARAALVMVGLIAAAACGRSSSQEVPASAAPPRAVLGPQDVAVAERADLTAGVVLTGSLQPYKLVQVKSQVSGTVRGVRVDRGTPVKRGQVMASIEAEGVQSEAVAARANLALAQQKLDAARTLYDAGAMSAIDFKTAQAAVEAAQAEAARAEEAARRSTITAPISGVVSARSVDGGEAVGTDAVLFTVVNSDTLELAGQIPVEQAAGVRVGAPVAFTLNAAPGRELSGRVARIDPVADPLTRQVGVYVQLANRKGTIIGGQFANGRIVGQRVHDAVVVPEAAIRGTGDSTHVLVIAGDQVQRRAVTLGTRDQATSRVAIVRGLQAGERVIITPSVQLTPGTKVTVTGDQQAAAGETVNDSTRGDEGGR
ncbi:MAG TPA: efflux RND transporter periplasmic adaptor subunit [Gemmatimonadaceae bacterium]|nr:efflux RND transporter periplasmic adaptor subunit [Gemmatimonadaceae bacterium]